MDDIPSVEVGEGEGNLGDVEFGHVLREEAVHGEEALEVTADEVLHDEEDVVGALQAVEEVHAEGALGDRHRVALGYDLEEMMIFIVGKNPMD